MLTPALAVTLDQLAEAPAEVLLADRDTPAGFRIIALSHLAEACAQQHATGSWSADRARTCVDAVATAALDPRIAPLDPAHDDLGQHGLYLSHLAIVLGERDRLRPDACDEALHVRVVDHLVSRSLEHPAGVARSFPSAVERWPTDQAATLYALWRFDQAHGTTRVRAPLELYLPVIEGPGLPPSELTGVGADSEVPRGSSLAFAVRYLAPVAPDAAADLWARTTASHLSWAGDLAGLREWPVGTERPADIDSGPIVAGIGVSATAFGRIAAQAVGDTESAAGLSRTASWGEAFGASLGDELADAARSSLAVSISAVQP